MTVAGPGRRIVTRATRGAIAVPCQHGGMRNATRVELAFGARVGRAPQGSASARGRIVLLGEHLDHQGGTVLAVGDPRGVVVCWAVRPDRQIRLHALDVGAVDVFDTERAVPGGRPWADLARAVVAALRASGARVPGLDLVAGGDLPPRRGLGSSGAWTVAILEAVLAATGRARESADVARRASEAERRATGVPCGPLDPYLAAVGRPDAVVRLDCATLAHEVLPLPKGTRLEAVDTGVTRTLADTPYAERRRELGEALAQVRAIAPDVPTLVAISPERFAVLGQDLPDVLRRRARHVVEEADRVRRAQRALAQGDGDEIGRLMDAGHRSLAEDFESTGPEIDARAKALRARPDVLGVRLQGAGWGGCLAVLRRTDRVIG
jgi:galactokinase